MNLSPPGQPLMTASRSDQYVQLELRILRTDIWPTSERSEVKLMTDWGLAASPQECVWVIAFDAQRNLRTVAEIARDGHAQVKLHLPTLLAAVLLSGAERFTLVHNHVTGNPGPSAVDLDMTRQVAAAGATCGLYMEDHLIVTPLPAHYSFRRSGIYEPITYPTNARRSA